MALRDWTANQAALEEKLFKLNSYLRKLILEKIPGVRIAGSEIGDPQRLALVVNDIVAEQLLREMEKNQILIDAGSACSAAALAPSHVLSSMGLGEDGQLRFTLKSGHNEEAIENLVAVLETEISKLRAN